MESKQKKAYHELGTPSNLSEENQGFFIPQSDAELLIKRLLWILEPEVIYKSDPKETAEDALNRSRLRARDSLLQVLNHLPEDHPAVKEITDALRRHNLLGISVGIDREAPGEFSKVQQSSAKEEALNLIQKYLDDHES